MTRLDRALDGKKLPKPSLVRTGFVGVGAQPFVFRSAAEYLADPDTDTMFRPSDKVYLAPREPKPWER